MELLCFAFAAVIIGCMAGATFSIRAGAGGRMLDWLKCRVSGRSPAVAFAITIAIHIHFLRGVVRGFTSDR